jgi:hypothetical protein
MTDASQTELQLPETSGFALSTGNLGDITKEAGNMSSLSVLDRLLLLGSLSVGDPSAGDDLASLSVNSVVLGLSLQGKSCGNGQSTLLPPHGSAQGFLSLPDGSSGSVWTSGHLPTLQGVSVLSAATVTEAVEALGDTTLGHRLQTESLNIAIPLSGLEALRLGGIRRADGRETIVQASAAGLSPGVLHLPDVSGVVLLSSTVPTTQRNATFQQRLTMSGGSVFDAQNLRMGRAHDTSSSASQPPLTISLEHAHLMTPQGLLLASPLSSPGRREADAASTSLHPPAVRLGVEEPTGSKHMWLPDASGTILTSEQLRDNGFERLRVMQDFTAQGSLHLKSDKVTVGVRGGRRESYLSIHARLAGSLIFDCDASADEEEGTRGPAAGPPTACLSLERSQSEGDNVMLLPDASGTVLTTGNLPNTVVTQGTYSLSADTLLVSGAQGLEVGRVWEAETSNHASSFVFTDALPLHSACQHSTSSPTGAGAEGGGGTGGGAVRARGGVTNRDNQFVAVVRGGVRFETGVTRFGGKALGSLLPPGASSWSSLSDASVKTNVSRVLPREVMAAVGRVPVSVWWYATPDASALDREPGQSRDNASTLKDNDMGRGTTSQGGATAASGGRRLGAMAQDVAAAFGVGSDARRIDSIDADGSLLAALQGCAISQEDLFDRRSLPCSITPTLILASFLHYALGQHKTFHVQARDGVQLHFYHTRITLGKSNADSKSCVRECRAAAQQRLQDLQAAVIEQVCLPFPVPLLPSSPPASSSSAPHCVSVALSQSLMQA